ncbi:LysR family transcriptional regulator [Gynuella sunshinyii]|uniref:Transcriptional regulator n=1 Tax=Gynuella sunshinyii YC6258 TaxID=1445510 RepID=A0A0C5VDH4_9GAMM|nr:LysR family transcriptional regulator [Gynuella sunshinyii]AJQ97385.1 transcriptional regulator [Gynuella sunshinyii YC6258]
MDISDLIIFKAVVDNGGISAAARSLHRVPSNITARIKKLEESLQLALFSRDNNRLQLTPTGQRLMQYAREMIDLHERAISELHSDQPAGRLSIGSMESSAAVRLPSVLVRYHQLYPQVQIELTTGASGTIAAKVLQGALDVALVSDPPDDARLETLALFEESLIIVKPPTYNLQRQGPENLPEPLTIVGFTHECSYRNRLESWLARSGRRPDRTIEIPSYHTMLSCVIAGMGIAMVPEAVLALNPAYHSLISEAPENDIRQAITYMIWRKNSETPAIRALANVAEGFSNMPS